FLAWSAHPLDLHSFPTRRSSDLGPHIVAQENAPAHRRAGDPHFRDADRRRRTQCGARFMSRILRPRAATHPHFAAIEPSTASIRSEEHTSELQSRFDLVCRLLLE